MKGKLDIHMQKIGYKYFDTPFKTNHLKTDSRVKCMIRNSKTLGTKHRRKLCDIGVGEDILDMTSKQKKVKQK
jgi:hypothetical protein